MTSALLLICLAAGPDSLAARPLCLDTIRPASAHREPDRWLAMDKFWHFSASFVSVGAGYQLFANQLECKPAAAVAASTGGAFTLGICKEFYDLFGRERRFSWKDLVADAAGIGAGYLVFIHKWN